METGYGAASTSAAQTDGPAAPTAAPDSNTPASLGERTGTVTPGRSVEDHNVATGYASQTPLALRCRARAACTPRLLAGRTARRRMVDHRMAKRRSRAE